MANGNPYTRQMAAGQPPLLSALLQKMESAGRACDRWLASGHIADYRTWQWNAKQLEEAEVQYADFHSSAQPTGTPQ